MDITSPRSNAFVRSRAAVVASMLLAVTLGVPVLARGQQPPVTPGAGSTNAERAAALTRSLAAGPAQLSSSTPTTRQSLEQTLVSTAVTRRQLLLALMESEPDTVLRLVLSPSVRAQLPSAVRVQLEEETQLEGTLEILHQDEPAGARYVYGLHVAGSRYSLHFAEQEPTHLTTGARIRVHGIRLDTSVALAGGGNTVQTVTPAPASIPTGEQRTLVMLVNFADNPAQPWTRDQVYQAIFGTMNDFVRENSYGTAWVTGNVTDWFTVELSTSVCDVLRLGTLAAQAAEARGWRPADYPRWVFAFPHNVCDFAGAAVIGGAPSRAWLNGTIALRTTAHEFGHSLGLWHSHSMDCGDVPLGSLCTTVEYGDSLDVMGGAQSGHYGAFQKERLGWLRPLVVAESGTYVLNAYETAAASLALKVLRSTDATTGHSTWLYLEARKPVGFDSTLVYAGMTDGVVIRLGSESSGNTSYMLDMSPNSLSIDRLDPALVAGQTFTDPDTGVAITTDSVTPAGATVTVRLPGTPPPPLPTPTPTDPNPTLTATVSVATDQPSYTRNQQVSILTTVRSGTSPVAGASVTFTITDAAAGVTVANATTGSDGTAVYRLRLKRQNPPGTYRVGADARKDALTGTAATTFTVR